MTGNLSEHLVKTNGVIRHLTKRTKKCARIPLCTYSLNTLPNCRDVYSKNSDRKCIGLLALPSQGNTHGGPNSRNLLSPRTGGQRSEMKVSVGLVPSEDCEVPLPTFWAFAGQLCSFLAIGASPRSLRACSRYSLSVCVCVCVQTSPFHKVTRHTGIGAHILNDICEDPMFKCRILRSCRVGL